MPRSAVALLKRPSNEGARELDTMKRPLSSLPALFRSTGLLVALAAVSPGVARAGEQPATSRVSRAARRVHVHRVWCAPGMETDAQSGASLYAHVEAAGFKWQSLSIEVRLRTPDGKPVRVLPGTPKEYGDDKGRFRMSTQAPVLHDPFEWKALRASVPCQRLLDLPADRPQRLIASFQVACDGLSSLSEAEITIPPGKPPGVRRAVRLLAIDAFPNRLPPNSEGKSAHSLEKPGRDARSNLRGLAVEAYVEAVGLEGGKMTGRLSVRPSDADRLASADRRPAAERPTSDVQQSPVVSDQAQILLHFIDYRRLHLAPGPHPLILSYSADCEGLRATLEEEHVLQVGRAGEKQSRGTGEEGSRSP